MASPARARASSAFDVARLAGVSQSAVSRAFTEGASISPEMRERIHRAATQLGYRPNMLARSLIKQTSNIVGVVFAHFDNPFFALALDRLTVALSASGLRVLLLTAETNATVDKQVDELLSYRVRAVILMAVGISSALAAECARAAIPVIFFNRTAAESGDAFAVTGDNEVGAAAIAAHLMRAGRRRLAFMAGYEDSSTSRSREAGFTAALVGGGLPPPRRVCGDYTRAGAVAATRALFADRANRPDAVFCANDVMAIAAIETLRSEFGLEPGAECAVVGFDDIPMASWPSFALTTYSQPLDDMVQATVRFIGAEDLDKRERRVTIGGRLITRKTA